VKIASALLSVLALMAGVSASRADIISYTGNTNAAPTYNRPLEDLSALSVVGTAVRYETFAFRVSIGGQYTVLSTARFDPFVSLYAPSLNPVAPLASAQIANDDLLGLTTSGFAFNLAANTDYTVVTTGFGNTDSGIYSNTIGGGGTITAGPVPPPATVPNILSYTGNTSTGPTYNRPLEDLSALSVVGTDVRYDAFTFRVSTGGAYTFLSTAAGFDPFLSLYAPSLDPLDPLASAQIANDDLLGLTTSGFTFNLAANTDYTLVTTGFGNSDFGTFSNTIGGGGDIIPSTTPPPNGIPEPATLGLLLLGLLAAAAVRTPRRSIAA
jgi:hypothetical protein